MRGAQNMRPGRRAVCPGCGKILIARRRYGSERYVYPRHSTARKRWIGEPCAKGRSTVPEAMLMTETGGFTSEAASHLPPERIS